MKLNTSGTIGLLSILAMFVIAFLKDWSVSWLYFVLAIVICSIAIISLSSERHASQESLWAWNCALLALATGLLLNTENWLGTLFLLGVGIALGYAVAGVLSLLTFCGISHALGIVGLAFMIVTALAKGAGLSSVYAGIALILYGIALGAAVLSYDYQSSKAHTLAYPKEPHQLLDNSDTRLVWGTHLALILAAVGLLVGVERFSPPPSWFTEFKGDSTMAYQALLYTGLLIVSIFGGLAIPHLLFREK